MNYLKNALNHPIWLQHKVGQIYQMDGTGKWKIAYYPIFECGKTGKQYKEPRALVETKSIWDGKEGTDFREIPLNFLKPIN